MEALLDAAFGADRRGRTAYRLRAGMRPIGALSFAAFEGSDLVGTLQSWPVQLDTPDGEATALILVGPVAVAPAQQGCGIGRTLMDHLLAGWDGEHTLLLIGDPDYYGRFFGFTAEATGGWDLPGPFERRRLLARPGRGPLPAYGIVGPRR